MSDTLFALWIGLSAVLLLLFVYAAAVNLRNRQGKPLTIGEVVPSLLPVDIETFSQVIHQADLPQTLSPQELKQIRRERADKTIDLLRRMAHNAAVLQRVGYGQLNSGNELISDLAQQMIDAGVHVRLYTFIGLAAVHLCNALRLTSLKVIPAARLTELQEMLSGSLIPAYEQLKDKAGNLTCLKFSGMHEALTANL